MPRVGHRRERWVCAAGFALALGLGCSSSNDDGPCAPGDVQECFCDGGDEGGTVSQQVCGEGREYGACQCSGDVAVPDGMGGAGTVDGSGADGGPMGMGMGGEGGGDPFTPPAPPGPGMALPEPTDTAAWVWDQSQLRTYRIDVAPSDLAQIDSNPAAEEWVTASLQYEGETYDNVGLRYKGSIGAFRGCTGGGSLGGGFQASGPKTCPKLSMKVSFNWQDPEGRFHGLKKLQFHSMNNDPSLMRERLGYSLFREMGIAAPRAVHARLLINGEFAGLFVLIEHIDSRFTRAHFTDGEGNLYKEIWPKHTDPNDYLPALRTNENDPTLSLDRVTKFADALEAAPDDTAVADLSREWMDVNYLMNFIAVDRALGHDDGMFHWYCGFEIGNNRGDCSNHNYFWYEEPGWDRLWLVPWDLDLVFGGAPEVVNIPDAWNDTDVSCEIGGFNFGGGGGGGGIGLPYLPPGCDKLTAGWASLDAEYRQALQRVLDGPFTDSNVTLKLDAWTAQIESVVDEAASHGHDPSPGSWNQSLTSLRGSIDGQRQDLRNQL